jgi:transcriptional antiterminator NusG
MTEKNWYIVNVLAGQENKILNEIKSSSIKYFYSDKIEDIIVPIKKVIKIKKGKKIEESQKIFPGYIFIKAELDSSLINYVNSIQKVIGFLGPKNNPEKVPVDKIQKIFDQINDNSGESAKINFELGEILKVIDGPFESFTGNVESFDQEKQKVRISISIFGRATSVELEINQVEKIS